MNQNENKNKITISQLPHEIIYYILSFIPIKERIRYEQTCRDWKYSINMNHTVERYKKCRLYLSRKIKIEERHIMPHGPYGLITINPQDDFGIEMKLFVDVLNNIKIPKRIIIHTCFHKTYKHKAIESNFMRGFECYDYEKDSNICYIRILHKSKRQNFDLEYMTSTNQNKIRSYMHINNKYSKIKKI